MDAKRILVVDDEPGHRLMVRAVLEDAGWEVFEAERGDIALDFLARTKVNAVLLDIRMPGPDGLTVLARIKVLDPQLPVIMLTAYGSVGSAVEAMKQGAFDYLSKPADNEELKAVAAKAHSYSTLLAENEYLKSRLAREKSVFEMIGGSQAMRLVKEFIEQVAPTEATVLILGESGTGKELAAGAIHENGSRRKGPLVKVNCAALPGELLESELFGYERGAFTGANTSKPGRFQLASGGTLFLDEIGEIPLTLQAKLLRAIQERVVEPLGGVRPVPTDVRILAATNRDLKTEAEAGRFRLDLYYRLNVVELRLPALRERMDDLPLLVGHLLTKLSEKNRKAVRGVSPQFLDALTRYPWPGNVRELENVLERALVLSRSDTLGLESLPPYLMPGAVECAPVASAPSPTGGTPDQGGRQEAHPDLNFERQLEEAEKQAIVEALRVNEGHRERTADALGISRRTLQYKLRKYGLTRR